MLFLMQRDYDITWAMSELLTPCPIYTRELVFRVFPILINPLLFLLSNVLDREVSETFP